MASTIKQSKEQYLVEENEGQGISIRGFSASDLAKILIAKGLISEGDIK